MWQCESKADYETQKGNVIKGVPISHIFWGKRLRVIRLISLLSPIGYVRY